MKSKHASRLLSVILVITLLIQMVPIQVFATQKDNSDIVEQASATTPITIVGEEITLRGEAEKHFRLSDGSYIAVSYGTPVHYMDSTGDWQDIDNRPIMSVSTDGSATYQIKNGDKATVFPSVLSAGTLFSTASGNVSVSMRLLDTVHATELISSSQIEDVSTVNQNLSTSKENMLIYDRTATATLETESETVGISKDDKGHQPYDVILENLSSSILYEDVFPGVDLRYEAFGYSIKEEIIIHEEQNCYRYDFLLELNGLTPLLNDNGSIDLVDSDNISIYQIPAPFMFDAAGAISNDVAYSLMDVPGGTVLTVTASEDWINQDERVFPITIDPTLNLTIYTSNYGENLNMYVTFVEESIPNGKLAGASPIYVGYGSGTLEMRGYVYVNNLPTLPMGAVVTRASLDLYMTGYSGANGSKLPVGLYEVTSGPVQENQSYPEWIRSLTWNTKPTHDMNHIIDYEVVSSSTVYFENNHGPVSWELTELVKKWYAEDIENRSFALCMTSEDRAAGVRAWFAFAAYGSNNSPKFIVNYRNNVGIEPYYTYTTLGAGAAGAAYIADSTGQLKIGKQLLGYSSSVNHFSLNLIYNSDYFSSSEYAEFDPFDPDGTISDPFSMFMGEGWMLDCIQKIDKVKISNTTYLRYFDGDGTIHYFVKDSSKSSTYYYDEDGLGLKIQDKGSNSYVMSNDFGDVWNFPNGMLTEYTDENGNKLLFNYSDGKLETIIQKNTNSNAGITVATFSYCDDGRLNIVTDAAGNIYTLCYTDSGDNLTAIKRGNTILAQYEYTGNRVTRMIDSESGYAIAFSYGIENYPGRIIEFQEQILDLTSTLPTTALTGATVKVEYPGYTQTIYRDFGNDRTQNENDLLTYYLFDFAGRTVNAYTTDVSGKILGASNAVYSGSGSTDKANNRTLRTASIGIASQQLLKNPSFESEQGWNFGSSGRGMNPRTGQYALSLSQETTSGGINLSEDKTYTVSAYVDTSAATGFIGRGVYLKVSGSGSTWEGIPLSYQTSTDNKWARISVTFKPQTTGAYTLFICNDGVSGSVYVDDVQLEEGEAPSNYNLLENGNLSMGEYGWTLSDAAEVINGTIQITGSPRDASTNASQTIQIHLPSTETYVLSGWVTANAVPDTRNTASDPAQDTNKQCGLRAAIHYEEGGVEYHYVPFNTDLSSRQFVSYTIVPNPKDAGGNPVVKTVSHIVVTCAYETNANTAYFDDISLVREASQTMKYDNDGNLESVTTSGLNADLNTYEGGNLIKTVTGNQGIFEYGYDDIYTHRITSITQKDSSTEEQARNNKVNQTMSYDDFGNVVSTTLSSPDSLTMSTSAQYTNSGNLLSSVTDPAGATVTYGYTNEQGESDLSSIMWGLPTSVTAPNGTVTSNAYDLFGRVTQTSVADLAELEYTYDKANLKTITRTFVEIDTKTNEKIEKKQTYNLAYDSFGKTTSISVGSRQLATYEYLARNGPLSKQTYGNGHTVSFTYDNLGRTKTVTHKNGPTLSYTYTGDGQLYSVTESLNDVTTAMYLYQYDTLGNLVGSEKLVGGSPVLRTYHSYNDDNKLSSQGWQIGADSFTQTYSYDTWDGNLSSIALSDNDASTSDITVTYDYDGLRRLESVDNGVFTRTYNYVTTDSGNATTRLESFTHSGISTPYHYEWDYSYEYDVNGNIISATHGMFRNTYVYDANNQLIRENKDRDKYTQTWEYDEFGNITATRKYAYTTEELGEPTSEVLYGYTDSSWGDLLTEYNGQTIDYDNIGNPLFVKDAQGNVVKSYTWAQGRQMASYTTNGVTWTYTYDADGMRTGRTDGTNTYEYIYAGDKLVRMIYNGAVSDITYAGSQPLTLTYDGEIYYYVLNGQGDVIGLTDDEGKMVIGYHYGAYGVGMGLVADAELAPILVKANPLLYRGYVYDRETKFYYLQSRYYDPEMGRFINADSYASTGQGVLGNNMFAYCNNNPVVYIDPTGKYIDWDLYPNQQAGREFAEWYTNTDESEEDDSGKPTLGAKIKRTYKSIFYNIEFSAGVGVGFGQEFEIVNLGESVECHYDRIAVQYSDGIWRFGDRLELTASVSATQAYEFGIGGMDCFRENGVPIDPTYWVLYNDKKTTWTLWSYSNYTCFVGGNIAIGFDLNTFLYDMTEIWG